MASPIVLHEKREWPLQDAVDRQRIELNALLPMRIALAPNVKAMQLAETWVLDVSDPTSPSYGKHWSQRDVIEAFQPTSKTVNAVIEWLSSKGISKVTHTDNKQWIAFDLSAEKAEELFQTTYYEHVNADGHFEASCDAYYLPEHIQPHVDFITPALKGTVVTGRTERSRIAPRRTTPKSRFNVKPEAELLSPSQCADMKNCSFCVTPECIRALYNFSVPDPNRVVSSSNHLGVFERNVPYYQPDLNKFYNDFTNVPAGTSPVKISIDGGVAAATKDTGYEWKLVSYAEADVDIEIAQPVIYPQNVTVFAVDDRYWAARSYTAGIFTGQFNTFLDALDGSYCQYCAYGICGDSPFDPKYPDHHAQKHGYEGKLECGVFKPTNVISISYGVQDLTWPFNYQRRQCNEYLKLALQGVSIFVASGDFGVGVCSGGERFFDPFQPNDCPWVVAVGGTQIPVGKTAYDPEVAVSYKHSGISSGGGFSLVFDAPDYQKKAIAEYYKISPPPYKYFENGNYNSSGRYNRNGRGIPDVSAIAGNIAVWAQNQFIQGSGTSASSPLVASLFNLIIEERLKAGKKPLGLLNPSMYQHPELFTDITKGSNPGLACGHHTGFEAAKGWDPVTGLGTPKWDALREYYMSLP